MIGVLIFAVVMIWRGAKAETIVLQIQPVSDPNVIQVYVGGEVVTPGLVSLPRGSRVADAIDAAGGKTPSGDTSALGMAAVVEDADQIVVPVRQALATAFQIRPVSGSSGLATAEPADVEITSRAININTATASELEALPGIGPALAARIVEHRETNGPFGNVDELEAIKGISERMVDEMRELITVGS
jgi:competence protein ComEA